MLAPRHWVYLDSARTHEVHAQVACDAERGYLVTTEFPAGSRAPTEVVQAQTPIEGEAALARLLGELEERLALNGTYHRTRVHVHDVVAWTPVPPSSRKVDLRAHEVAIPGMEATGGKMRFHVFHSEDARDRMLVSMPRPGAPGRHVLAVMPFEFPRVDVDELSVVHARLAAPLLASVVTKEHVEAPRRGFTKLFDARDYESAYGRGWADGTRALIRQAAARLVGGPSDRVPPQRPPERLARIQAALASPRVEALRALYLDPAAEALLVEGGEHAIRRFVGKLRSRASHRQAYDISVLEAALLLEYALPAQMWDLAAEEGAKLARYIFGYNAA